MNNSIDNKIMLNHKLTLDNRKNLYLTGVSKVDNIHPEYVTCHVCGEVVEICGKDLHVDKLDVQSGNVEIGGVVNSIKYCVDKKPLLKRLFK